MQILEVSVEWGTMKQSDAMLDLKVIAIYSEHTSIHFAVLAAEENVFAMAIVSVHFQSFCKSVSEQAKLMAIVLF